MVAEFGRSSDEDCMFARQRWLALALIPYFSGAFAVNAQQAIPAGAQKEFEKVGKAIMADALLRTCGRYFRATPNRKREFRRVLYEAGRLFGKRWSEASIRREMRLLGIDHGCVRAWNAVHDHLHHNLYVQSKEAP